MNIGILGAGNVGGALGESWARRGHQVTFGVRDPNGVDVQDLLKRCAGKARAGSTTGAAAAGVVVNALPWNAAKAVLENARLLEPYAMLWIWLAIKGGMGRDFAFKIVKR